MRRRRETDVSGGLCTRSAGIPARMGKWTVRSAADGLQAVLLPMGLEEYPQMILTLEHMPVGIALLFPRSIVANRFSERLGVPALLIFLIVGMLACSEGPGGIPFDDPAIAQM